MKNNSVKFKNILFLLILFLLFVPILQSKFKIYKVSPLNGAIILAPDSSFSFNGWFSGRYQIAKENFLNDSFGFRNIFIRINNQIAFNLFKKAKANGVIIGKENYLYEENYIKAFYGTDFIGVDSIKHRMNRLRFLQDTLSKLNKNLILIFAAGKGSYYPEYFPDNFKKEKGKTNYEYHVKYAKYFGLNYIDFNKYFLENKFKSKYPMYPKYGIHWSYYGMCLAADSIVKYIENKRNIIMPHLYWNKIDIEDAKEYDYDIGGGMNLLFHLKSEKMAYPEIQMEADNSKTKPSVLVIADSYYWGMFNFGISKLFSTSHFWFYNQQIFPESFDKPIETSQINLKDEILKHDVIIIMGTEATLPKFGWGFIENAYNEFHGISSKLKHDEAFMKKVYTLINYIKTDANWYNLIKGKAAKQNITIDSALKIDAIWQIEQDIKK
jgi:hypothetical protein